MLPLPLNAFWSSDEPGPDFEPAADFLEARGAVLKEEDAAEEEEEGKAEAAERREEIAEEACTFA